MSDKEIERDTRGDIDGVQSVKGNTDVKNTYVLFGKKGGRLAKTRSCVSKS